MRIVTPWFEITWELLRFTVRSRRRKADDPTPVGEDRGVDHDDDFSLTT